MSSAAEVRSIALHEFSRTGYAGTSIARIADAAGLSKSAVLYHYASKEALLEAAIGPAVDAMKSIVADAAGSSFTAETRRIFLERFIDLLLTHRLEVHMFINQGPSLVGVPVIARANQVVLELANYFAEQASSTEDRMRFGIALGGAAYSLSVSENLELESPPEDETRAALRAIMAELLTPVGTRTATAVI